MDVGKNPLFGLTVEVGNFVKNVQQLELTLNQLIKQSLLLRGPKKGLFKKENIL